MRDHAAFSHLLDAPLLKDLPGPLQSAFLRQSTLKRCDERCEILAQGGESPGIFMIVDGHVEISYSDEDGNVSVLHVAGSGEVVGEVEAIAEKPCAASCVAVPDTRLLLFPKSGLAPYLGEPSFTRSLVTILYHRLMRDNEVKSLGDYGSVDLRLRMYLWQMSGSVSTLNVSQDYLATVVGCTRETVNRRLRQLRDEGVIELERGLLRVVDRAALRR